MHPPSNSQQVLHICASDLQVFKKKEKGSNFVKFLSRTAFHRILNMQHIWGNESK